MPINFNEEEQLVLEKIQSYCLYQERCLQEVKNKLLSLKVNVNSAEKIIKSLKENDYLNEDRYVKLFIQGKLRIKKWGKIKLKNELRIRSIDKNIIEKYINGISETDYLSYFNDFSRTKIERLKGTQDQKKRSFINYFTYRGWENTLIYEKLKDIN
mgnify:CR=1 FL=1|tara:strand:+ start:2218 stop:2685 length:468 start_codon:yes stop_codon:yes gene_type:complete